MFRGKGELMEQLEKFLRTARGNKFDQSAVVYKMIKEAEEPQELLEYFLDKMCYLESSQEEEVEAFFTAAQIQVLQKEFDILLDGILNKLISKHLDKKAFYCELWKNLESDILFEKEEQKIYALYRIWIDKRIPYFQIEDGIKMSDEEFQKVTKKQNELLHEIVFVMNCSYIQKTERSGKLLGLLDKCEDNREKSVLLAYILDIAERNVLEAALRVRSD